jgi:hypothetical protein
MMASSEDFYYSSYFLLETYISFSVTILLLFYIKFDNFEI